MRPSLLLAGAGVALLLAAAFAAALRLGREAVSEEGAWLPSLLALGGAAALLAAIVLERRLLRHVLAGRQARLGFLAGVYTLSVLVVLGTLAALAVRHSVRLDLTIDRRHTLSGETLQVLSTIPEVGGTVEIFGVIAGGALEREAAGQGLAPLLRLYDDSSRHVEVDFVEAARRPALVQQLGVSRTPSVAVRWTPPEGEARVRRTDSLEEESITAAIEQALLDELRVAHVLGGHGERAPDDRTVQGLAFASQLLVSDNHDVRPLFLVGTEVPEESSIVIVPGPRGDLLTEEVEALDAHVRDGGRVMLLVGPTFDRDGSVLVPERLGGWLEETFGLTLGAEVVKDLEAAGRDDLRRLHVKPAQERSHPIVANLNRIVVFPLSRPVRPAKFAPHGAQVDVLLRSGELSWAEAEQTGGGPSFEEGVDEAGPHPLAVAISFEPWDQEREGRLVVFGSDAFAANGQVIQAANAQLFLDAVAWLEEREEVIEARAGTARDGTTVIPRRQGLLILACAAAIPLVVAGGGIATWWHRRRL